MHDNSLITARAESRALTNAFLRSVYNWMALGLGITAAVSYLVFPHMESFILQYGRGPIFALALLEIVMVFYLAARISKLSGATATGIFLVYSALNGITLTSILFYFTGSSIASAFICTAGMFAALSVYGLVTKRDLTAIGSFCFMGLFGVIIAMVLNIFFQSSSLALVINIVGIIVFVGLTAYDTQKLKEMGEMVPHDDATAVRRGTIMGALTLYLDFINLFILLVQFGNQR